LHAHESCVEEVVKEPAGQPAHTRSDVAVHVVRVKKPGTGGQAGAQEGHAASTAEAMVEAVAAAEKVPAPQGEQVRSAVAVAAAE